MIGSLPNTIVIDLFSHVSSSLICSIRYSSELKPVRIRNLLEFFRSFLTHVPTFPTSLLRGYFPAGGHCHLNNSLWSSALIEKILVQFVQPYCALCDLCPIQASTFFRRPSQPVFIASRISRIF